MKFYGIADAHGLDCFEPVKFNFEFEGFQIDPRELSIMVLRANANRHRHAIVYQVDVSKEDAMVIKGLYDKGECEKALLALKDTAKTIKLAKIPGAEKSWKLIPNDNLDPYS
jgi:hypothetical protein